MTAVDTLIASLNGAKISARAQPIVVPIDDLIAALQQLSAGGSTGPAGGDLSGTYPNPVVAALQGRAVSAAVPIANDVLTFGGVTWAPAAPVTNNPAIVQTKAGVPGSSSSLVMDSAPIQGNILIAITANQNVSITASAGWTKSTDSINSAAQDNCGMFWKVCGAAESTTQTPNNSGAVNSVVIWELNPGAFSIANPSVDNTGTGAAFNAISNRAGPGGIMLGAFINRSAVVAPSSITGATAEAIAQANSRTVAPWHMSTPIVGTNTITPAYGSSQGYVQAAIAIG